MWKNTKHVDYKQIYRKCGFVDRRPLEICFAFKKRGHHNTAVYLRTDVMLGNMTGFVIK